MNDRTKKMGFLNSKLMEVKDGSKSLPALEQKHFIKHKIGREHRYSCQRKARKDGHHRHSELKAKLPIVKNKLASQQQEQATQGS